MLKKLQSEREKSVKILIFLFYDIFVKKKNCHADLYFANAKYEGKE